MLMLMLMLTNRTYVDAPDGVDTRKPGLLAESDSPRPAGLREALRFSITSSSRSNGLSFLLPRLNGLAGSASSPLN